MKPSVHLAKSSWTSAMVRSVAILLAAASLCAGRGGGKKKGAAAAADAPAPAVAAAEPSAPAGAPIAAAAAAPAAAPASSAAACGDFWCEATKTCVPDWWTCGGLAGVRLAPVGNWRRPEPWIAPVAAFVVVLVGTCIGLSALRQRLAASCPGLFGDTSGQPAPLSKDEYT